MDQRVSWHAAQYLHLRDYGAVGNGTIDDTAAVYAWIMACAAQRLPGQAGPGTYMVTAITAVIADDLTLHFARDAIIKGTAEPVTTIVTIDGDVTRPSLRWYGGTVDNSSRGFISAGASGTGITLKRLDDYLLESVQFLSTNDYRDLKGDSGISVNTCNRGTIRKCYFRGQPDLGVYLTGGSDPGPTDDHGDHTVEDCVFYRCAGTAAMKRSGHRTRFINNHIIECRTGFSAQIHRTAINLPAPQELIVSGNYFKKHGSRVVNTDAFCRTVFTNNIVEDWGYEPEGTIPTPSFFPWAVAIQTQNSVYSNNIIGFRDWSGTGPGGELMEAFRLADIDYDDGSGMVVYQAINNVIDNNTIINTPIGIRENNSSSNNIGDNMFVGVATPIVYAAGSTSHFGLRTNAGVSQPVLSALSVGKSDITTIAGAGFKVGANFQTRITFDGAAGGNDVGLRLNRLTADGPFISFYRDNTAKSGISSHASLDVSYAGSPHLKSFNIAALPAASACTAHLVYLTDGAASKRVAVSDGTIWRYMDGTAV